MKEILVLPGVMVLLIGFSAQLFDLAEAAGEKGIAFTGDMVDAIDCAAEARPLTDCSPGLYSHEWEDETAQLQSVSAGLDALGRPIREAGKSPASGAGFQDTAGKDPSGKLSPEEAKAMLEGLMSEGSARVFVVEKEGGAVYYIIKDR